MEESETEAPDVEVTGSPPKDVDFDEGFINSGNLCRILPFHVMVDRKLHVVQCGESLNRRIGFANGCQVAGQTTGWRFADVFRVLKPDLATDGVTYENILALQKCVFVLELLPPKSDAEVTAAGSASDVKGQLVLRGNVTHVTELDHVVFLTRPDVTTFADLRDNDLELSDIPSHDPTRDLIIWNELYRVEKQEVAVLAEKVEKLQREVDDLETEKALSNRLLHSILPPPVADQLRTGNSVEASRYGCVSILFSGICEFGGFCLNCRPIDVVCLLNDLYSQFDDLTQQGHRKVYKVETVGDKYMLVSGLPEKNDDHAQSIATTALDMLDIGRNTTVNGCQIRLTVGVHSGEAVAGVVGQRMPHYAVFGGAVCQASRMESTGLPDHVNVSEATYKILKKRDSCQMFDFKERGSLTMKGFAEPIKCYLLFRSLTADQTGNVTS